MEKEKALKEKCHACGRIVTPKLEEGYGQNQTMAKFYCQCGEEWMFDIIRRKWKEERRKKR